MRQHLRTAKSSSQRAESRKAESPILKRTITKCSPDDAILKHISRQPRHQAGYKQLVREMGLHGAERHALDGHLQKLVKSGQLIALDSSRYALPQAAADKNLIADASPCTATDSVS